MEDGARLSIGYHVGMTNTIIQCHKEIVIGDFVNIGAGTMIFDTDFHSLDWEDRATGKDIVNKKCKSVVIGNYSFVGASCIILKGVSIGEKSIVGAGSVVASSIPSGEIWAGNPARFNKKIQQEKGVN